MMLIILLATIIIFFISLLLSTICKLCEKLWRNPIQIQKLMNSQGIKGPNYSFLHGNTKQILELKRESTKIPMEHLSHDIFPRLLPHIYSWKMKYGANFLYWLGPRPELVVTEPKLVKEILSDKNGNFPKIDLEGFSLKLLGDGVASSKGEKWVRMRKLANNAFHGENLTNMIPAMIESVETMLEKWRGKEGEEIEVVEEFRVLTSDIISRTAFGSNYLEGKNIFEMLIKLSMLMAKNSLRVKIPIISKFFKSKDEKKSEELEQGIKDGIIEIIKKRIGSGDEDKENNVSSMSDFLGKLLEANNGNDDGEKRISIQDIVDECKTLYFAGHETTSTLLSWVTLLLATHEEWQDRARNEVLQVFGDKNHHPNADGIARLKIMNMIIEETLRLYPPVPYIKRTVKKDKIRLGGLTLPRNILLNIPPLALQHDPQVWGEDSHVFNPQRFSGGVIKATNNNPMSFAPFGHGPRICLGLSFAMCEAKIALSMMLQRYRLTISPTYVHSPAQPFMIRPQHGVQVFLHTI